MSTHGKQTKRLNHRELKNRKRMSRKLRWVLGLLLAFLVELMGLQFFIDFMQHPDPLNTFRIIVCTVYAAGAATLFILYG